MGREAKIGKHHRVSGHDRKGYPRCPGMRGKWGRGKEVFLRFVFLCILF